MSSFEKSKYLQSFSEHRMLYLRVFFGLIAALFLLGDFDRVVHSLGLGAVYDQAFGLLEDALKQATGTLVLLTVMKGFMQVFSSIEVSVVLANANLGGLLAGLKDVVDTLFRFFLSTTGLLTAQIGFLSVLKLAGLKMFIGGGALLLALNPSKSSGLGKLGIIGIAFGLVFCILFPLLVGSVGSVLNQHQMHAAIESSENLGVMREQFSDINIRDLTRTDGIQQTQEAFQTGTRQIWDSMLNLFVSYTMMFIFLPLISLGVCYAIVRHILKDVIDSGKYADSTEGEMKKALSWITTKREQSESNSDALEINAEQSNLGTNKE